MIKFIFILMLIPYIVFAEERIIGNIMSSGAEAHYTVVVEKYPRVFHILEVSGDNHTTTTYVSDILIGKYEGPKRVRGDERTPQGVYYITSYMSEPYMIRSWGSTVAARYGSGAFPINYPNPIDRILGRTGSGIWIHGLEPERHKPVTEGCVAMQNEELDAIKKYLSVGMPVVIVDNATFMSSAEYEAQRQRDMDFLNRFIGAWRDNAHEVFSSFIHPDYSSYAGSTAAEYIARRRSLMERFPEKTIDISNVRIYRQNDESLVYDFDQFYCAPNIFSFGNKRIYLINADDGQKKIISEEVFAKPADAHIREPLTKFLNDWKLAWESGDIDRYMEFYAQSFPRRDSWHEQKRNTFAAAGNIRVDISDINWDYSGGNSFTVRFKQDYASDVFASIGIKTLRVVGCPGSYKIESETWSRS